MQIKAQKSTCFSKLPLLMMVVKWLLLRVPLPLTLPLTLLFAVFVMLLVPARVAMAAIDVYQFESVQQEQQYRRLIHELRCPKCQNQSLAGSNSPIAEDLKQQIYKMLQAGKSDAQIRQYMLKRYGDFISYKPPVRPATYVLWFMPPLLLFLAIVMWLWRTHQLAYWQTHIHDTGKYDKASEPQIKHNQADENECDFDESYGLTSDSQLTEAEQVKLLKLLSVSPEQQTEAKSASTKD